MSSVSAFNDLMSQFLSELRQTFPEEKSIKKYDASFDILRKSNPRKCVDTFMTAVGPYSQKIQARDESIFDEDLEFLVTMNIKTHWTPELSSNTKDAIWQYLNTLYMLGTTITAIPKETLDMIEGMANKCMTDMSNNGGEPDEKFLMNSVSSLIGSLGSLEGGLGSLLGEKKS